MIKNRKAKLEISSIPWILPLLILLPYAVFVDDFRLLSWVITNSYLPFWLLLIFSILSASVCSCFLVRAKKLGRTIFNYSAVLLIGHCTFLAMLERRHAILVLLFLLSVLVVFLSEMLRTLLAKPYFDAQRDWFESIGPQVPSLRATVHFSSESDQREARVCNLGEDGCFLFLKDGFFEKAPSYIILKSGEKVIMDCMVQIQFLTKDKTGIGLRYMDKEAASGDWKKDYFDFIYFLRRAGYAK